MNYFWMFFCFGIAATAVLVLVTWLIAKAVIASKNKRKYDDVYFHSSLKDKVTGTLGLFGDILWYIISFLFMIAPAVALDWNVFIIAIIRIIPIAGPYLDCAIWVYALFSVIKGPQDIIAIIFYVMFVIHSLTYCIPLLLSTLSALFNLGKDE